MRIAVLRQLSKSSGRSVGRDLRPMDDWLGGDPLGPRLVRCECSDCGAHSNAIVTSEVHASCTNCGASRLLPVQGACLILGRR
jgi:hypothetical protein